MTTTRAPMFLCLFFGEELVLCEDEADMRYNVELHCQQQISDHYRGKLPVKYSEKEHGHWFDVRVFVLTDESRVDLAPHFQEIIDEYYDDMKTWEPRDKLQSYERYLELREEFENITEEELEAIRKAAKLD